MKLRNIFLFVLILGIFGVFACNSDRPSYTNTRTSVQQSVEVEASIKTDDFDMETLLTMIREGKVSDLEEIQKVANSEETGINNVDIDNDDQFDYVVFQETAESNSVTRVVDLIAVPSKSQNFDEGVTLGQMKLEVDTTTNQLTVSGGYSQHVHGYQDHYYNYHMPYAVGVGFGAYMFRPHRVIYAPGYYPGMYVARPVMVGPRLYERRQAYRQTRSISKSQVSPIKKTRRPQNMTIKSAQKKSKYASTTRKKGAGSGVSARKGATHDYKKRDSKQTKKKATAFKPPKKPNYQKNYKKPTPPSRKTGSSSGYKKPRSSSGWGGSSSSRSRSRSSGRRRR